MVLPKELKKLLTALIIVVVLSFIFTAVVHNPYSRIRLLRIYYSLFPSRQTIKDESIRKYERFPVLKRTEGVWLEGRVNNLSYGDLDRLTINLSVIDRNINVIVGSKEGKVGYSEMNINNEDVILPYHSEEWSVVNISEISNLILPGSQIALLVKYEKPYNASNCSSPVCEDYLKLLSENLEANSALADSSSRELLPNYSVYGPVAQILVYK